MDRDATLAIKHAPILLLATVAAGCGGSHLGGGGSDASGNGGAGGGGGSPAACCPNGGQAVASIVHARGFTAYEGRPVKATFFYTTFATPNGVTNQETSVSGGAFDLEFPAVGGICTDGGSASGWGAIYIDADGDGVCDPAIDYFYAWPPFGGAASACETIDLTPQSPNCGGKDSPDIMLLEAAQAVCPATGGCLTCPRPSPDGGVITTCLI